MTDFDKTLYWKGRMNETITRAFDDVMLLLKDMKANFIHAGGDMRECEQGLMMIGDGFNELKRVVDAIGEEKVEVRHKKGDPA